MAPDPAAFRDNSASRNFSIIATHFEGRARHRSACVLLPQRGASIATAKRVAAERATRFEETQHETLDTPEFCPALQFCIE